MKKLIEKFKAKYQKPWGWHVVLFERARFKVKLLYFKEGGQISMQRHKHRAEVWCFVYGRGAFKEGKRLEKLTTSNIISGDFASVGKNKWHHYVALERTLVLEVQHGELCSEDDIERSHAKPS